MILRTLGIGICCLILLPGWAQQNIVPNGGFESISAPSETWFFQGSDFTRAAQSWTSATQASPDLYSPSTVVPESWQNKGFGDQRARTGQNMAGITLYGCTKGKPHCREYLQVGLTEPTVPGQEYRISLWTAPLKRGLRVDRMGVYFSDQKITGNTDRLLEFLPQVCTRDIISDTRGNWQHLNFKFTADTVYRFLLLGNFSNDENTGTSPGIDPQHSFAYYYVDDIEVRKIAPLLSTKDPLAKWYPLSEGRVIEIQVLFDIDKHTLKNRAQLDLDRLLLLLSEYPEMQIEISGHTDSSGNFNHNMSLSDRRANSVVQYLHDHGIDHGRMIASGHGPTQPVASNGTIAGRQLNRRVEFKILRL